MFEVIKNYYKKGLYTDENVKVYVEAGTLSKAQYEEITGKPYTGDAPGR